MTVIVLVIRQAPILSRTVTANGAQINTLLDANQHRSWCTHFMKVQPAINVKSVYSDKLNPYGYTSVRIHMDSREFYWSIQNVVDTCKSSLIYNVHTSRHACRSHS